MGREKRASTHTSQGPTFFSLLSFSQFCPQTFLHALLRPVLTSLTPAPHP